MTRVLLVTGKGGVGKTTVAGATAVHAAADGARVLVTSTDPAHSLGDLFDVELGDSPRLVAPNLQALQLDGQARLEEHWADVRDWLVEVFVAGGADRIQAAELVLLPGMDELFALLDVERRVASGAHDLVVVDCAPTAETLRLLTLPDALAFYTDRLLGPGRRLARLVRPVTKSVGGVPLPDDQVFSTVDDIHRRLATVRDLFTNPDRTTVRLVLTPERMVVAEALRTATALSLFGHAIDAVVLNRVIDSQPSGSPLAAWHDQQQEHLATVEQAFPDTCRLQAGMQLVEPIGVPALAALGRELYEDRNPIDRLSEVVGIEVEGLPGGSAIVRVPLPFARRDDVDVHRRGRDLHVTVGTVKRVITLPASLATHRVAGAGLSDGNLVVRLESRGQPHVVEAAS